jgi:glutamate racemase
MNADARAPIGIFDSGVGGLSVLREIRRQLPHESTLYFADQGHVPYGPRSLDQVKDFSEGITRFLLGHGAKLIVVACNSASAAALTYLRDTFPDVAFVGMEPAVKPAAEETSTRVVGVLATPATFQGALFASVVERFASGVELIQGTCPGLVERIEIGDLTGPEPRRILERTLLPMLDRNIDTIVLACTHYPFVIPLIQEIAGSGVRVIDPAPAIARQTARLLEARGLRADDPAGKESVFYTSHEPEALVRLLPVLLEESCSVRSANWTSDTQVQNGATREDVVAHRQ